MSDSFDVFIRLSSRQRLMVWSSQSMRQTWKLVAQPEPSDEMGLLDESHFAVQRVEVPQATFARTLPL